MAVTMFPAYRASLVLDQARALYWTLLDMAEKAPVSLIRRTSGLNTPSRLTYGQVV